jgi:hypothetical protein
MRVPVRVHERQRQRRRRHSREAEGRRGRELIGSVARVRETDEEGVGWGGGLLGW